MQAQRQAQSRTRFTHGRGRAGAINAAGSRIAHARASNASARARAAIEATARVPGDGLTDLAHVPRHARALVLAEPVELKHFQKVRRACRELPVDATAAAAASGTRHATRFLQAADQARIVLDAQLGPDLGEILWVALPWRTVRAQIDEPRLGRKLLEPSHSDHSGQAEHERGEAMHAVDARGGDASVTVGEALATHW